MGQAHLWRAKGDRTGQESSESVLDVAGGLLGSSSIAVVLAMVFLSPKFVQKFGNNAESVANDR